MQAITANDLKRQGVSVLANNDETVITVRGRPEYVVVRMGLYEEMRAAQMEMALLETQADIKAGRYKIESAKDHVKRISKE